MRDLSADEKVAFRRRLSDAADRLAERKRMLAEGRWREIEPDRSRALAYERRARGARPRAIRGPEAIQGADDLQEARFIVEGARRRRAVAKVEIRSSAAFGSGTGFLISRRLFITNQHVVADEDEAAFARVIFDDEYDEFGLRLRTTTFTLDAGAFALFSPEHELDYAVVALGQRVDGAASVDELGFCPLSNRPDRHRLGMPVNIVQHPNGWPKMLALRQNRLLDRTDSTLLYETDTMVGSSGAPVFNDDWDVVALHHYGEPFRAVRDAEGREIAANMNEGIRISAIVADLEARLPTLDDGRRRLLADALALGRSTEGAPGPSLSGPRPGGGAVAEPHLASDDRTAPGTHAAARERQEEAMVKFVAPLEITLRIAEAPALAAAATPDRRDHHEVRLASAAEKLRIDRDYANRAGYDPDFIPDLALPPPLLSDALRRQIAPLRAGEPNAAEGVLKYQHFSVVMNRTKRLAIFTATNIDGDTYLKVDRDTGLAQPAAERETWFHDTRISESFTLGQSFYDKWSIYFDRGHLTRRTDVSWGEAEDAERANADTFHFSNCSPQHFRFNQTVKFWQGAERYVLEKGVTAGGSNRRASVFQGPIWNDRIDRFADDQQIPSLFFKVIVWRGAHGVRSVGLIVDQLALLDERRVKLGQPSDAAAVDVSEWRAPIAEIERRTGLDFGTTVREADTMSSSRLPAVGERMRRLAGFEELLD